MTTAIILAGQRPGGDPLAQAFAVEYKALIEVAGKPMLARVVRELMARADIGQIIILAQAADRLLDHPATQSFRDDARIIARDCGDSVCQSIIDTLEAMPDAYPFLLTTADNVLLDQPILTDFVAGAAGSDLAAALVERQTLLAAYPDSRRTWLPFRRGAYSGANLFWLGTPHALRGLAVWRGIEQQRKKARAVLGAFGGALAVLIALRLLTLDQAIARVGRRLELQAKAVVLLYAAACIDVDKPADHAMAEAILKVRG